MMVYNMSEKQASSVVYPGMPVGVLGAFSQAVSQQNNQIHNALRCLAALDEQLVAEAGSGGSNGTAPSVLVHSHLQATPRPPEVPQYGGGASAPAQPAALASLALMRRLLVDAQAKFRKMVEDNKTLAQRIDGEVAAARADVGALRGELADASRRLEELAVHQQPSSTAEPSSDQQDNLQQQQQGESEAGGTTETTSPGSPTSNCRDEEDDDSSCSPLEPVAGCSSDPHPGISSKSRQVDEGRKLREENTRLRREVAELRCLLGPDSLMLSAELQSTREALAALKADRKRLKAEKFDLLNQMKQLYGTLEDKEKELRDFIRNYEQRARETEVSAVALAAEREERERERWGLLRHARDEAERSLALAAQLTAREAQLHMLQEQLVELRRQAGYSEAECRVNGTGTPPGLLVGSGGGMPGDRGSSADSGVRGSSDRESGATSAGGGNLSDSTTDVDGGGCGAASMDMDAISLVSSIIGPHTYQSVSTPKDSPTLSPLSSNPFARMEQSSNALSRSVEQLQQQQGHEAPEPPRRKGAGRLGRGGTWGSISRVFARSRHRKMASPSHDEGAAVADPYRSWSPLTEEGYAEKLRLLREAASVPMERWRAPTVLAWLEIALGMPQYGPRCAENVKSGKVLLELSDAELEAGLGISHPMHRKKLRLAIEEHRHPGLVRYPCIAQLGHTWVSSEWLPDLGLAQYSENFATNMVDARMLDHLSKKELEKMLGVTRKFHQASVVHGIHLLRMIKYDRQALAVRRHQCENIDTDPLVWTNQRFIRWARNIDLGEYADNLKDSGVHGALVVLEPSFNGETMATALGIPPSKNIIRRHLTTELEALILPARSAVEHYMRASKAERRRAEKLLGGGSLGRSFSRSYAGGLQREHAAAVAAAAELHDEELEDEDSAATSDRGDKGGNGSRRSSLRGSLSRALGLRVKQELQRQHRHQRGEPASPESSSLASPASEGPACSFLGDSEPVGLPASSSSTSSGSARQRSHRRVRSIGDIDAASAPAITPV